MTNEVMKCLEEIKGYRIGGINSVEIYLEETKEYNTIRNYILKSQAQEKELENYKKAWEIAKEKCVNIRHFSEELEVLDKKFTYEFYLLEFDNYHYFVNKANTLTQEEFDLLKEVLENGK